MANRPPTILYLNTDPGARIPGMTLAGIRRYAGAVGHSVQDEIEHVRMERVFTLLRDTKTPISAVAALCGWRSDIALRWLFRRRTGMSMRQWRRENT